MVPQYIKDKYKIVWEIPMRHVIDMAADRGAFICQSQSLNLWIEDPNYNTLTSMHFYAWEKGLKTTYYLRSMGATNVEKSTINERTLNAVQTAPTLPVTQACSITDPDCEACQ